MSNWQPFETAPKDGTLVDLWLMRYDGTGLRVVNAWFGSQGWRNETGLLVGLKLTHWCPISGNSLVPLFVGVKNIEAQTRGF